VQLALRLLFVLAFVVTGTVLASLVLKLRPETSHAGIGITVAALIVMPVLASLKRRDVKGGAKPSQCGGVKVGQ